jgi:hypothetical protein
MPFEKLTWHDLMGDKVRGGPFDFFEQVGNGNGGVKSNQEVNVVGHAADGDLFTLQLAAFRKNGSIDGAFNLWSNQRQPIPGGPDAVDV